MASPNGLPNGADGTSKSDAKFKRFNTLRQETNDFATFAYGHAGTAKILTYDLQNLIQSGAVRTAWSAKGTIFSENAMSKTLLMYFMIGVVTAGIMASILSADPDAKTGSDDVENISAYLNGFIPLILGFYISVGLVRWWELREGGVGRILDASQNVILILSAFFPDPVWHDFKDQVLKYALASVTMLINAVRGNDSIDNLGPKRDYLLTEQELNILLDISYRSRPVVMWGWIYALVVKICDEEGVPAARQRDLSQQCVHARDAVSVVWTYLNTQLPFAYVHLVTLLVNVNNLVMAWKCGLVFAVSVFDGESQRAVNQLLYIFLVPMLYHGLLSISYIIHDPFGEDMLDFPIMAFQEYMNETAASIIDGTGKCPGLKLQWGWGPEAESGAVKSEYLLPIKRESVTPTSQGSQSGKNIPPVHEPCPEAASKPVSKFESKDLTELMMGQLQAKEDLVAILTEQNRSLKNRNHALDSEVAQLHKRNQLLEAQLNGTPNGNLSHVPTLQVIK
eukprot:gnl/MRDRNA2_/MRDRNA2_119164_c0_seq1.p1 gnl/MRDRNA2_/MRDRNA2_119164_c0~~gnl/MRDRNA2_/MRDRNA2_119164_c0_seq1.p1  ORF type:complete len:508 (-),score=80.53 gnl/MRDRNA2_/MRDRNA2_119164_c0_seq1:15-1538(-)